VILCKENEKDLEDIPEEIRKNINFHIVEDIGQVLDVALNAEDFKKLSKGSGTSGKKSTAKKSTGKTSKSA